MINKMLAGLRLEKIGCTLRHSSEARNTTGYYRVYKHKNKRYTQGFTWCYNYYEKGKKIEINSVNIDKLKEKVIARGLEWKKIN